MKNVFWLIAFFLLVGCEKNLMIQTDHPASLTGSWVTVNSVAASPDTFLVLGSNGSYLYSISIQVDSVTRDTSYLDSGSWEVQYLDVNNNQAYDDGEDAYFYSTVSYSTITGNIGRHDYCRFNIATLSGVETMKLCAEDGLPLFTWQRITTH